MRRQSENEKGISELKRGTFISGTWTRSYARAQQPFQGPSAIKSHWKRQMQSSLHHKTVWLRMRGHTQAQFSKMMKYWQLHPQFGSIWLKFTPMKMTSLELQQPDMKNRATPIPGRGPVTSWATKHRMPVSFWEKLCTNKKGPSWQQPINYQYFFSLALYVKERKKAYNESFFIIL